jgi:eukaryotic-like serine/threonine-protein kinase
MPDGTVATYQAARGGTNGGLARVAGWNVPGYTALKALGSGGFGDVVMARHDASGTMVAIKFLRPELLSDPEFAEMFRGEAAVLASISDPNVVRLYDYVESPSGAAIVMELVDGVSLRKILEGQGATTPEAALVVLEGSLLGLAAAHERGVVHRDYKPDNVLVDADGASKLTDFGIAARSGDRAAGGTLAYAPPEQFSGEPSNPAGDVYAATATFFECLTGRPPFHGDTAQALLYQHMFQPVPVDAVPEPVRPLVAAGLAKDPEDRPADAARFVAALNALATRTYGPDWRERGRSFLGEAALLLAALWPSGGPPAVQGSAVQDTRLHRRVRHSRLRRSRVIKSAIAASSVGVAAILVIAVTHKSGPVTLPAITGVSPASGTTTGGTAVTITGTGLAGATVVRFGGVAGTITADSATQITVTTAAITVTTAAITVDSRAQTAATGTGAGTVDITVTTAGGTSHPAAADRFTYTAARPAITGVAPSDGTTAGGTTVTITGTGLAGATSVRFGGVAGTITADSSTEVTVTSPPGSGTVDLTVITPAGTSQTSDASHYAYATRPGSAQSISFTTPASQAPASSAHLSATGGGSGKPVVFSVDPGSGPGVCTVSGDSVSFKSSGSCTIDANQAGNGKYTAAPQVQRTITVKALSQAISLTAPSAGTVNGSGHLSATGGGSGNPVILSSGSGKVCTVSGNTVTFIAGGSCTIDANQAGNAEYSAAPQVQRTIEVSQLPQSITFFAPPSGTVLSSASLSAIGGGSGNPVVFSVGPGSGAGVCSVSGTAVAFHSTGTCIIDANQAGNAEYAAAPQVQRTIAVTKTAYNPGGGEAG